MDVFEYSAMIEETPVRSRVVEYHAGGEGDSDPLIAVCLTDMLSDGVSMVYSFFDPDLDRRSLGTFMILDQIAFAQEMGLPFVYLGYWVEGSDKMDYKSKFSAVEVFVDQDWYPINASEWRDKRQDWKVVESITDQVAQLSLPTRDVGRS